MNEEKNTGDKDKIEDKYFKQSIPGLNRLLNILGIPGEIVSILPNEYQNYRDETKTMDLVFDLKSKETLNLEFKSTYVKKEDIEKSLDYATYLRIFSGEEHLENLKDLLEKNEIDDETEELNDLLLIPFMESDKSPKELIVECITLANQIRTVNRDKLNDIKNLLLFLATKYTDTDEEFDEIERLVKMEGGMIQNTIKHFIRIGKQEGIELEKQKGERKIKIIERELKEKGIEPKAIENAIKKAENETQKL